MSIDRLAYLSMIRNVRRGLLTRTEIIRLLDNESWITTTEIAQQVNVTYNTVLYHLKHLLREEIIERDPQSLAWRFGPVQQSDLTQFLSSKKKKRSKN
ncbi:MAG: ArsR family transcriptional regulator [Candidatus Thorarchaeota archaeon]|nr:ArsR family transcriptional regulator [Candidatus Thorarchaeota archaeon]